MKRKTILLPTLIFVVGGLVVLVLNSWQTLRLREASRSELPELPFILVNEDLAPDYNIHYPTILVYFDPACEYCEYEAASLQSRFSDLQHVNILMVSSTDKAGISDFARRFDLQNHVRLLHDQEGAFPDLFGVNSVPSVFIYDSKGKLLQLFKGETKIEAILSVLSESKNSVR